MKPVDCEHWLDRNVIGGGFCKLGRYGGRPSLGTCDYCQGKVPRPPDPALAKAFTVQVTTVDRRATEGPKRWAALHQRALAWDGTNPQAEMDFIRKLADGLGMCSCRKDWATWLELVPPDLSSAEGYYAWSVNAHDAVNARLGKPKWAPRGTPAFAAPPPAGSR